MRIMIPRSANYMDDMNKLTVSKLLGYSKPHAGKYSGSLEIFMTEKMLHAKLLASEKRIMIGSCNINKRSFTKLDELAVAVDNDDSPFAEEIRSSIRNAFRNAECTGAVGRISYDPVLAALETAVM